MRVHHQPGFALLNRPYTESSWIVEVFTLDYGRISLMAKGARRPKSRLKGVLLPFQPLLLSWLGKGEIPTLTGAEIDTSNYNIVDNELVSDYRVCGFYCNELVVNLLHRHDPHKTLYEYYRKALLDLSRTQETAIILRQFERVIIKETGYEISFEFEPDGVTLIDDRSYYQFVSGKGFIRCDKATHKAVAGLIINSIHKIYDARGAQSQRIIEGKIINERYIKSNIRI